MSPPFEYTPFNSAPYAASVAELLARQADPYARAAVASAQARARAQEIGGEVWGRAIGAIGAIPGQIQQQRRAQLQDAHIAASTADLTAQAGERAAATRKAITVEQQNAYIDRLMSESMKADPATGVVSFDRPTFEQSLVNGGKGHLYPTYAETLDKLDASAAKRAGEGRTMLAHALLAIEQDDYSAESALTAAAYLKANHVITAEHLQPVLDALAQDASPETVKGIVTKLGAVLPEYRTLQATEAKKRADLAKTVAETEKLKRETTNPHIDAFQTFKETYPKTVGVGTWEQLTPQQQMEGQTTFAQRSRDPGADAATAAQRAATLEMTNQRIADLKAKNSTASAPIYATRPDPAIGNTVEPVTGLTPNALYQAGMIHALEGKFPPVGMGQSTKSMNIRTAVQNTSAAMANQVGVDITELRAEYRANATTLNKLLPAATFTAAAADTATDNLQLALDQSAAVARSGSKFVNRYTQWVQGAFTPAQGLTKFETYIYTAAREYAKVVSGSAQSVAGLSDTAAAEATKLLNAAQAPESFAAAVTAMQDDMANVTKNQRSQMAAVSQTIANFFGAVHGTGATAAPPPPATAAPVTLGQIVIVRGQKIRVTKIGKDGTYEGVPVKP